MAEPHQREATGELVKLTVPPTAGNGPLAVLLMATHDEAAAAGLIDQYIDAELAAWKAEHSAPRNCVALQSSCNGIAAAMAKREARFSGGSIITDSVSERYKRAMPT